MNFYLPYPYFTIFAFLLSIIVTIITATSPTKLAKNLSSLQLICCYIGWAYAIFFCIPITIGMIGRGELSPLPWVVFLKYLKKNGLIDAVIMTTNALITDVWILWIPGNLYAIYGCKDDKTKGNLARVLNLSIGLLFLTPGNPLYWLLKHMPTGTDE